MGYLKDFRKQIELNNYFEFLKLWEEYCYSEETDAEELIQVLKESKESLLAASFGNHVEKGLTLWEQITDPKDKSTVLKLIFDIETTNSENLADIAFNYLKETYPDDKLFTEKVRLIGLRSNNNFQGAISKYELLTHLNKGNFVYHTAGWGTGEILDLSLIREEMTLEFEYVVGKKHLTFKKGLNTLLPLGNDHFLSRRFGDPDSLEAEAKKSPVQIICLLLKDLGNKNAIEIKEELCDLVIPEEDWSKWWQATRSKIKKSTLIISPSSLQGDFKLREKQTSHEEILYSSLDKKPDIIKTIHLIYSFLRDFPETLRNKEFKTNLHTKLTDIISFEEISPSQKIQILFLLNDLVEDNNYQDEINKTVSEAADISALLKDAEIISLKKKILKITKLVKDNWIDIFLDELFEIKQNILREYILAELEASDARPRLEQKLLKLLNNPKAHPRVFVWYFLKLLKNKSTHLLTDQPSINKFHEGLMIILDNLSQKVEHKDLTKKIISELTDKRFILVRNFIKNASLAEVKEFLLLSTKCTVLSDHEIKIIHSLGEVEYPELKALNRLNNDDDAPALIWTTQEGLQRTQDRLKQIATKDTVENAKEIEEARSHGDLRENAEFKAALERRDRLQGEMKLLSDQLSLAQVITVNDINTKKAGVGTVVECEKGNNDKVTFTILGPWEANPEKNILSFQSKLALSMNNLAIGENFNFQNEEYTISNISSFLN